MPDDRPFKPGDRARVTLKTGDRNGTVIEPPAYAVRGGHVAGKFCVTLDGEIGGMRIVPPSALTHIPEEQTDAP